MVAAVANPHTDVLGHCTGRMVMGGRGTRPESEFDAEIVFAACEAFGVAVEINSRPERLDPPANAADDGRRGRLPVLRSTPTPTRPASSTGSATGARSAAECDVPIASIVNTWSMDGLLAWTGDHDVRP